MRTSFAHAGPAELAGAAVLALREEALLTPKPGLVDRRGRGAHIDMDLALMLASADALREGFAGMARAAAGIASAGIAADDGIADVARVRLRAELAAIGRATERDMLAATGGVNTHRGAIWALGLLTGAAAVLQCAQVRSPSAEEICVTAARIAAQPDPGAPSRPRPSNGEGVASRYGSGGARAEAESGFPHARLALGALRRSRARGADEDSARLDGLLTVMATLSDTCLLHRGGTAGLALTRQGARAVLVAGGVATSRGRAELARLDRDLTRQRLSPGGAADLLAAALYLEALTTPTTPKPPAAVVTAFRPASVPGPVLSGS